MTMTTSTLPTTKAEAKALGLKQYNNGSICKRGHQTNRFVSTGGCTECAKLATRAYAASESGKAHLQSPERKAACRESMRESMKEYRKLESHKAYQREYSKQHRAKNLAMYLARDALRRFFGKDHYAEQVTGLTLQKAESLCGYTSEELVAHITALFKPGMSWDKRSEWHIDHIKSVAQHRDEGITDLKVINALSNLQPLWAMENYQKGRKKVEQSA